MNRDDIIRMAREEGVFVEPSAWLAPPTTDLEERVYQFAALVAAAEREACAKACENICEYDAMCDGYYANTYAAAIRARSKK
jgi:hypothetical protein